MNRLVPLMFRRRQAPHHVANPGLRRKFAQLSVLHL